MSGAYASIPAIRLHGVDRNNFTFSYLCDVPQASPACPYDECEGEDEYGVLVE